MNNSILLIGAGGHSKSIIEVIEHGRLFRIVGLIDSLDSTSDEVLGYSIVGDDDQLIALS